MAQQGQQPTPTNLRVVSLLPSATDTVVALGLQHLLVGRTHECDLPEVASVPICTANKLGDLSNADTDMAMNSSAAALAEAAFMGPGQAIAILEYGLAVYRTQLDMLAELRPDVILTSLQDPEQLRSSGVLHAGLQMLLGKEPKVVHLAAASLEGVWQDMQSIADALGAAEHGQQVVADMQRRMSNAAAACNGRPRWRVACIQWPDPWYAAGFWVPQMLHQAGAVDVLGKVQTSVCFTPESLASAAPDVLLFALCGFSLSESLTQAGAAMGKMKEWWGQLPAVKRGRIAVLDGNRLFSRPGPLLVESMEALVEVLHPEAQRYGHEGKSWQYLV
ncbi:hypothetical protein WJX72_009923 [[Myrmecia] bisecta]|uniref:Fe/B12 periplasmic-binding domain-containing protein n=1 Tax=[Myrmecia] bisecta TaxID=41462 RepID=A0AAW1R807_9CHLO